MPVALRNGIETNVNTRGSRLDQDIRHAADPVIVQGVILDDRPLDVGKEPYRVFGRTVHGGHRVIHNRQIGHRAAANAGDHVGIVNGSTGDKDVVADDDVANGLDPSINVEAMMVAGIFVDEIAFKNIVCGRSPARQGIGIGRFPGRIAHQQIVNVVVEHLIIRAFYPKSV